MLMRLKTKFKAYSITIGKTVYTGSTRDEVIEMAREDGHKGPFNIVVVYMRTLK